MSIKGMLVMGLIDQVALVLRSANVCAVGSAVDIVLINFYKTSFLDLVLFPMFF
jgi:hypothetical protein